MSKYAIYDPLTANYIPRDHEQNVATYWRTHPAVNSATRSFNTNLLNNSTTPELTSDQLPDQADVVIIGAGYTGLNAAIELARNSDKSIVVLEAGSIGAGCSSRNAGFVLPISGRLSIADYQSAFGEDIANGVLEEFNQGVSHVQSMVNNHAIACDFAPARYVKIAHTRHQANALASLAQHKQPWPKTFLHATEVQNNWPGIAHAYGALIQQPAARVHPHALVEGYARVARSLGVRIVPHCPVKAVHGQAPGFRIETLSEPFSGTLSREIQCQQVLVCSNAYAAKQLVPGLSTRQLPALSSVIVTEPLSDWQIQNTGLSPDDLIMDTRRLKYYYRLLPDRRLLFGGRGAVSGKNAQHPRYREALQRAMLTTMPGLQQVRTDYTWSGWVSVSLDSMPRVFEHSKGLYASMGYCGAGISFSSLAGKRLAQLTLGKQLPALPFYQSAPPHFPAARLRRLGQRAYYHYARFRDQFG